MISVKKNSEKIIAFFAGAICAWLVLSSPKETKNITLKRKIRRLE
jgi:hypothetical protein